MGIVGRSVVMLPGQVKILSRETVKLSILSVGSAVLVYAALRLSYSGYGVNTHGTVSWSQSSGEK